MSTCWKTLLTAALVICTLWTGQGQPAQSDTNLPPARDPFWPIGYQPTPRDVSKRDLLHAQVEPAPPVTLTNLLPLVHLKGFYAAGGSRAALVNNQVVRPGDKFGVEMDGQTYYLYVKSVNETSITISYGERQAELSTEVRSDER